VACPNCLALVTFVVSPASAAPLVVLIEPSNIDERVINERCMESLTELLRITLTHCVYSIRHCRLSFVFRSSFGPMQSQGLYGDGLVVILI
jgi:hypothetical protein